MSLHSSKEPGLYSLVKNITVNHISRSQSLLLVSTVTSNRYVGLLVADNVGLRGVRGYVRHGRPMATAVEI